MKVFAYTQNSKAPIMGSFRQKSALKFAVSKVDELTEDT